MTALDYGRRALLDTLAHLDAAGVAVVGAGRTREAARAPLTLEVAGARVTILAVADHPPTSPRASRPRYSTGMEPTPRDELAYSDDDVANATGRLRDICAALPEVSERPSHGAVTFFVRGKRTLCYLTDDHHGDGMLALVCPARPGVQEEMIESDPVRFFRPPYVGHRGWLGLRVDLAPDWVEVAAIVEEAYRCVAPVTLVRRLDGGRERPDA